MVTTITPFAAFIPYTAVEAASFNMVIDLISVLFRVKNLALVEINPSMTYSGVPLPRIEILAPF
ncbi:hypothetical protein D3C81_1996220 [compost metagenome]